MLWTVYFWLFAFLVGVTALGRIALYVARPGSVTPFEVVESLPGLGVVFALHGYLDGSMHGVWPVWAGLAVVIPIFFVVSLRSAKTREVVARLGAAKAIAVLGASFLFTLPGYVALVQYTLQMM